MTRFDWDDGNREKCSSLVPLQSVYYRHCERSEAIQGRPAQPLDHWIASSLRSSQ